MSSINRLNRAFEQAKQLEFDNTSKIICFSDCHRGDNSIADDFAKNRNIYYHALKHYYNEGFTYCELGDGNELWEHRSFSDIFDAHKNVYLLLKKFHDNHRLHMVWGNHDMVYKRQNQVRKHWDTYTDPETGKEVPLLKDLIIHEALVLQHRGTRQRIFMAHGHQADWWNYRFWRFSRFLVRILWKPLNVIGIADPTSPAKNHKEMIRIERRIKRWITGHNNMVSIMGHTHRPRFPEPGDIAYFNDGSCVHPRSITGIEIMDGAITLIKWHVATKDDGTLQIVRKILEGPCRLSDYETV